MVAPSMTPRDINNSNGYNTYVAANVFSDFDLHNNIKLCGKQRQQLEHDVERGGCGRCRWWCRQGYPDIQQLYTDWVPNTSASTPTPR